MKGLLLILLLMVSVSFGQQSILIEAEQMEYDRNTIIYMGNVKASRGQGLLTADKMIIHLDENKKAKRIEALGNPVYKEGVRKGKADKMEYDLGTDVIKLIGNARVEEGPNFIEADEIVYYRKEDRAVATSKNKKVRSFYVEEKDEKVRNSK